MAKYKNRKPLSDLRIISFHSEELGGEISVVIDSKGFKFFNWPSEHLITMCKELAKAPGVFENLPGFVGRDFA